MKIPADTSRLMTVRVDTPAALERALRAFAADVVITSPRADDDRERRFAEASALHQQLLARRLAAA